MCLVSLVPKVWSLAGPGQVRQLPLKACLESVSDSDHKRVSCHSWSLYKHEVPPVCIPGATGDEWISPHCGTSGTRDRAATCHKQEGGSSAWGGFSQFVSPSISPDRFTFHLARMCKPQTTGSSLCPTDQTQPWPLVSFQRH